MVANVIFENSGFSDQKIVMTVHRKGKTFSVKCRMADESEGWSVKFLEAYTPEPGDICLVRFVSK